ncbi:MAG: hypothetical protein IJV59_00360 [Eubacterium sp.]|nr:hypothetical protein [Eubacterium sp.]
MAVFIIWVIVIIVFAIASGMRKQKQQDAQRKKAQQEKTVGPARQTRQTNPAPNPILERAKQNTKDVHSSHVQHEKESQKREYGGGQATPVAGQTAFGSAQLGTAASGIPVSEQERIQKKKARLQRELQTERTDANSKSGRNSIMEAAKENALETRLDNLSDSSRDFMKEVQELMVKGPDDSLPNQRDFVAEGMEMINNALIR